MHVCSRHPLPDSAAVVQAEASEAAAGFTRVVIGQLKPDILRQIAEDARGQKLCRALAHLYHYYLHGEEGNQGSKGPREPEPGGV